MWRWVTNSICPRPLKPRCRDGRSVRCVQIINIRNKVNNKQYPHHAVRCLRELPHRGPVLVFVPLQCWCDIGHTPHATWPSAIYFTLLFQNTYQIYRLKLWCALRMMRRDCVRNRRTCQCVRSYIWIKNKGRYLNLIWLEKSALNTGRHFNFCSYWFSTAFGVYYLSLRQHDVTIHLYNHVSALLLNRYLLVYNCTFNFNKFRINNSISSEFHLCLWIFDSLFIFFVQR
jgi:hypothetical protein